MAFVFGLTCVSSISSVTRCVSTVKTKSVSAVPMVALRLVLFAWDTPVK